MCKCHWMVYLVFVNVGMYCVWVCQRRVCVCARVCGCVLGIDGNIVSKTVHIDNQLFQIYAMECG